MKLSLHSYCHILQNPWSYSSKIPIFTLEYSVRYVHSSYMFGGSHYPWKGLENLKILWLLLDHMANLQANLFIHICLCLRKFVKWFDQTKCRKVNVQATTISWNKISLPVTVQKELNSYFNINLQWLKMKLKDVDDFHRRELVQICVKICISQTELTYFLRNTFDYKADPATSQSGCQKIWNLGTLMLQVTQTDSNVQPWGQS